MEHQLHPHSTSSSSHQPIHQARPALEELTQALVEVGHLALVGGPDVVRVANLRVPAHPLEFGQCSSWERGSLRLPFRVERRVLLRGLLGPVRVGDVQPDKERSVCEVGQPYDPPPVRVRTDSEGRFRAEGVAAGELHVQGRALGLDQVERIVNVPRSGVGFTRLVLQPAASVAGVVRRADGRPVPNASVSLAHSLNTLERTSTTTDEQGAFELRGLPVGELKVVAELDSERLATRTQLVTQSGQEAWWDATFPDAFGLAGKLEDSHGAPLAGWTVRREAQGSSPEQGEMNQGMETTDADGAFYFEGCPQANQVLTVRGPGRWLSDPVVTLECALPGKDPITLRVAGEDVPKGEMRGLVLDANGDPVPGAEVELSAREPVFVHLGVTTGEDGAFVIPYLPASAYTLSVAAEGLRLRVEEELDPLREAGLRDLGALVLESEG